MTQLKGKFLISSPHMPDEFFAQTVIWMTQSQLHSSFGFLLTHDIITSNVFQNTSFKDQPIYKGGPEQPDKYFLIHSNDLTWPQTLEVNEEIGITNMTDVLRVNGHPIIMPKKFKITSGYVHWQMGQLEQELMLGLWIVHDPDCINFFDTSQTHYWQSAIKDLNLNVNKISSHIGTS